MGAAPETVVGFGDQRIYASGTAIMFARRVCYSFVRPPKRSLLQLVVILGRAVRASQVRRVDRKSKAKIANIIPIRHRDEVEPPITDWLREAYELPNNLTIRPRQPSRRQKSTVKLAGAAVDKAKDARPGIRQGSRHASTSVRGRTWQRRLGQPDRKVGTA